ncbi:hypothetical protein GCM10010330_16500 [Streptomyces tendae]|nr:hypothetical protein GCM10010330_16500 [Streptomyces tendae]
MIRSRSSPDGCPPRRPPRRDSPDSHTLSRGPSRPAFAMRTSPSPHKSPVGEAPHKGRGALSLCGFAAWARATTTRPAAASQAAHPSPQALTTPESARSARRNNTAATTPPSNTATAPTS